MLLQVEGISKDFDGAQILSDVSFTVDRGESVAVVAPSGAGKSTLLSIIGLLLAPSSGSVIIDGVDAVALSDDERSAIRNEKIGFLFQHTQLIGSLRAFENVALPADFARSVHMSSSEKVEKAKEMLVAFGLEDRLNHYPFQMSVGQKRRVATARALFLDPPLILADEPTNDLDKANAELVVDALFESVEKGTSALLFATHDMELASRATRIVRL